MTDDAPDEAAELRGLLRLVMWLWAEERDIVHKLLVPLPTDVDAAIAVETATP